MWSKRSAGRKILQRVRRETLKMNGEEKNSPVVVTGEEKERNTDVTKCPSCGANMVFSAEKGDLECPYCGTLSEIARKESRELSFANLMNSGGGWSSETHVFRCENCGARQVMGIGEIATKCAFCGTTNVVKTEEIPGLKPNAVVPFSVTIEQAIEKVKAWAKKKLFAPRKFKKEVSPKNVNGVYNPAFTFDTLTRSTYCGTLGKYYYETRTVNGKTERVRKIRYFTISGMHDSSFDDILVQASTAISQKDIDKMQPFSTDESCEYNQDYLNGFTASQYERNGMECWETAKERIDASVKRQILARYVYDVVASLSVATSYDNTTYKYVLLPVYVGHCKWNKKNYNFYVNGRNGKVVGKTPISPWRVLVAVLLGVAVVAGIIALAYFLE